MKAETASDDGSHEGDVDEYVIRVRGLPWSSTTDDILKFFEDSNISGGEDGVHFTFSREGRPSGEAYIEMVANEDMETALKKHNEHMGHRYIEVFKAKRSEMEFVTRKTNQQADVKDAVVRLRGLPFGCSKEEISHFFAGLEIKPSGITFATDFDGRNTGEAFVEFRTKENADAALSKHKEMIGHRYIEIFKSSGEEMRRFMTPRFPRMNRPGPYDRTMGDQSYYGGRGIRPSGFERRYRGGYMGGYEEMERFDGFGGMYNNYGDTTGRGGATVGAMRGGMQAAMGAGAAGFGGAGGGMAAGYGAAMGQTRGTGHVIHMRGLPFKATEADVTQFFQPLQVVRVHFMYDKTNRPSGEADVEFATHDDAVQGMSKDKANMQHRYIELFLNSTPSVSGGVGVGVGVGVGAGVTAVNNGSVAAAATPAAAGMNQMGQMAGMGAMGAMGAAGMGGYGGMTQAMGAGGMMGAAGNQGFGGYGNAAMQSQMTPYGGGMGMNYTQSSNYTGF